MLKYIKNFFNTNIFFLILLIVVVFALYGKSINFELLNLDDTPSITNNISYISNIKNISKIFLQDVSYRKDSNYYRPTLMLSFCLETILFDYNTKIYHLTNIILYIFCFYLIYIFFMKLKLEKNISMIIVLLFSIHPVLTSNIVYVSPRAEMLLTIFLLLSFFYFINYIQIPKIKFLFMANMFFLLALFSKETAIIFIVVLGVFIYCFDYNISKKQLVNIIMFLLFMIIIYFIFRTISVSTSYTLNLLSLTKIIFTNAINSINIFNYKILFPEYIPVLLYDAKLSLNIIVVNLFLIFVFIFIFLRKFIDRKKFLFCVSWYILFLIPNFFINEQQIFFHRLLLPLIGFELFLVLIVTFFIKKYLFVKKYLIVLYICLFGSFLYASSFQAEKYRNQENFIINSYIDSKNRISSFMLMDYCIVNGNLKKAKEILEEETKNNLTYRHILYYARIKYYEGDLAEAEEIAIKLEDSIKSKEIYKLLSTICFNKKDYNKSLEYLNKFKDLAEYDIWSEFQTARIYSEIGDYNEAINIYEKLKKFDRNNKQYEIEIKKIKDKLNDKESKNA